MLNKIAEDIKRSLKIIENDQIIFNNKLISINKTNFQTIIPNNDKSIAFIDGGQAEIISTGNFCLSFIRVFAQTFRNNQKEQFYKNEFYLFTKAKWQDNDLCYESKVYPLTEKLVSEEDLLISSNDQTIKTGMERAPISKVTNMARRFAELALANKIEAEYIVLDGTLEKTFKNEDKFVSVLKENVCALAKSSSLYTTSGNSPVILLNKIGLENCWNYFVTNKTYFVKLHPQSKHVFRFEGDKNILSFILSNCQDAIFLGYPYGLIYVDKMARVSNAEKKSLMMNFLLRKENQEIAEYLNSSNAHQILDNLG
jgi:hypothetical protein